MKNSKIMLGWLLLGTATFTGALWWYSTRAELTSTQYTVAGMVIALVLLSVVVAVRRIKTENAGLPADDELSQQIKIKSAAYAFAFSFMLWILVLLFSGQAGISGETMIGIGIAGMGLLFLGFWGYFSQKGIADENPH